MDLFDVAATEQSEKSIDAFIEKRAREKGVEDVIEEFCGLYNETRPGSGGRGFRGVAFWPSDPPRVKAIGASPPSSTFA